MKHLSIWWCMLTLYAHMYGGASASETESGCVICFEDKDKRDMTKLPKCAHIFCISCVKKWTDRNPSCPICSKRVPRSYINKLPTRHKSADASAVNIAPPLRRNNVPPSPEPAIRHYNDCDCCTVSMICVASCIIGLCCSAATIPPTPSPEVYIQTYQPTFNGFSWLEPISKTCTFTVPPRQVMDDSTPACRQLTDIEQESEAHHEKMLEDTLKYFEHRAKKDAPLKDRLTKALARSKAAHATNIAQLAAVKNICGCKEKTN